MKPVESEAFTSYMREKGVDEDKIPTLEKFSQGNIGKGLKLAQSDDFISMIQTIMLLLKIRISRYHICIKPKQSLMLSLYS